jgi:hypothetical protein
MANEELTKLPGGMLRYSYVLDDDKARVIEVFALAEVTTPYKQRFLEEIRDLDWIVEYGRDIKESPYRADFLICTSDAAI